MTTYALWLPLPPKACSQNCHVNWRTARPQVAAYKDTCKKAFEATGWGKLPTPLTIHLEFYLARQPDYYWKCPKRYCRRRSVVAGKCPIHGATFTRKNRDTRYYPKDEGNARAAFKAGQDSMVEAGLLPDDHHRYLHDGRTTIYSTKAEHQGKCGLRVTLEVGIPVVTVVSTEAQTYDPARRRAA